MSGLRSCFVVPCYNEAARLSASAFLEFLEKTEEEIDFLLVDDGSQDETRTIIEALATESEGRIGVLVLAQNQGKAEAVRQGINAALQEDYGVVGYWDADLATPLETIPEFLALLRERSDIDLVLGARVNLLGREIERSPVRHFAGRFVASLISLALGIASYDTQCGAKAIRVNPFTAGLFSSRFETRWLFDVEMIGRYLAATGRGQNLGIYEYPLRVWRDVDGSKVKASDGFRSLYELAKLYRRELRHLPSRESR